MEDLTYTEKLFLKELKKHEHENLSITKVAKIMQYSRGGAAKVLSQLENKGYIDRKIQRITSIKVLVKEELNG